MRRVGVVMAVSLSIGSASLAAAQEAASEGDPERQRLEAPEAGVAVALPAAWGAYLEMREKEDWGLFDEGFADEPVPFWLVIYASDGDRSWCDLTWYPRHPLTLDGHAQRYEALMTPSHSDVERPIEVTPVELPVGAAYRFDIYNEPSATYTTVYLLANGDAHYRLQCVGDQPAEDGWLPLAASLELLEEGTAQGEAE